MLFAARSAGILLDGKATGSLGSISATGLGLRVSLEHQGYMPWRISLAVKTMRKEYGYPVLELPWSRN